MKTRRTLFKKRVCKRCHKIFDRTEKNSHICPKCDLRPGYRERKKLNEKDKLLEMKDLDALKKECKKCGYLYSKQRGECPCCRYHREIYLK